MPQSRNRPPGETVFGIALLLLALFLGWQAYAIAGFSALSSPGAFPMAAAATMVTGTVIVVIGDLMRARTAETVPTDARSRFFSEIAPPVILIFTAMVVVYAVVLDALGFLPASFAFLFVTIRYLQNRGTLFSLVVSFGAMVVVYALFRLVFKVVLPEGIVPEREIMAWVSHLFSSEGAR